MFRIQWLFACVIGESPIIRVTQPVYNFWVIRNLKPRVTIRSMVTNVYPMYKEGPRMNIDERRRMTFPLRLAISLKDMANSLAQKDGVSLNHFISLAVAEKISRLESETLNEHHDLSRRQKIAVAAGVINKTLYS
jgi:hypothetical protein